MGRRHNARVELTVRARPQGTRRAIVWQHRRARRRLNRGKTNGRDQLRLNVPDDVQSVSGQTAQMVEQDGQEMIPHPVAHKLVARTEAQYTSIKSIKLDRGKPLLKRRRRTAA